MPRETSYTNTRLKKKDGCRERPKWYKVEQPQQPGVPGNKQPGRCSRELWQMSCWAAKSYSQPPTHTDFSAQLMELMFMYQTHFWNPKKLGWLIWKYFLFTRSERVKYQQFHVLQPNLKQSLWSSSCNLSLICVIMKLFFWVPLGEEKGRWENSGSGHINSLSIPAPYQQCLQGGCHVPDTLCSAILEEGRAKRWHSSTSNNPI